MESNKKIPSIELFTDMTKALDVTPDMLLSDHPSLCDCSNFENVDDKAIFLANNVTEMILSFVKSFTLPIEKN